MATDAPAPASARAIARPMPRVPPVTTALRCWRKGVLIYTAYCVAACGVLRALAADELAALEYAIATAPGANRSFQVPRAFASDEFICASYDPLLDREQVFAHPLLARDDPAFKRLKELGQELSCFVVHLAFRLPDGVGLVLF